MKAPSIIQRIKYPLHTLAGICRRLYFLFPNDRFYLKLIYFLEMGKRLNLKDPKRFSEKLQWLKLYDRKPEYTTMVDKYAVKNWVADRIGGEYIIPTLGVWDCPEEINFDNLPNQFVLKTTHGGGGGGVVICKDKVTFDNNAVIVKLNRSLKSDIYRAYREWPYKNVPKRIIAETYIEETSEHGLIDYKVFCFNGIPKLIKVNYDVNIDYKSNWYTTSWTYIKGTTVNDPSHEEIEIEKPEILEELLEKASVLSKGIPFARVDFYIIANRLKFGELTLYPGSGFEKFSPQSFDYELGSWIIL